VNQRRKELPEAHPYEQKTAIAARHLAAQERNRFVGRLRKAYAEIVALMP